MQINNNNKRELPLLLLYLKSSTLSAQWGCNGFDCWNVQSRVAGGAALTP
jgi:hypothetical protein